MNTTTTNAHQSAPTTAAAETTTSAPANTSPTTNATTAGLVRAILSTLGTDTAAALVALLVQWFRVLLAMTPGDREAAGIATDRMTADAENLGAGPHARAVVAALAIEAPHGVAANVTADGDVSTRRMSHRTAAEALDVLRGLDTTQRQHATGATAQRDHRASLADCRARAVRAMIDAALVDDNGCVAVSALHLQRTDENDLGLLLTRTLEALTDVAPLFDVAAATALEHPAAHPATMNPAAAAALALDWTDEAAEAVEALRDVLRALATGGAR